MKITVCELNNEQNALERDWQRLVEHVTAEGSDILLLPEMPFHPWVAHSKQMDPEVWQNSVAAHDEWLPRFKELALVILLGTRPIVSGKHRLNEAFIWDSDRGYVPVHKKTYLPDEEGFWEATWYDRGPVEFKPINVGRANIGFLVCTELWFMQHARAYGHQGIHLLACPRATPRSTLDKWLAGGCAAAVVSGAFCISSNLVNPGGPEELGGRGWIAGPDGEILGQTSAEQPFITQDLDLKQAERAKKTYPRYVLE